jgi:hypothetical protein
MPLTRGDKETGSRTPTTLRDGTPGVAARHQLRDGVPLGAAGRSSALASSALRVFCRPALQLEQVARRLS